MPQVQLHGDYTEHQTALIIGGRTSGKTTQAVEWLVGNQPRAVLLTPNESHAQNARRRAHDMGCDDVRSKIITVDEWPRMRRGHPDQILGYDGLALRQEFGRLEMATLNVDRQNVYLLGGDADNERCSYCGMDR